MRSGYQQLLLLYLYRKFCHCGAGLVDIHCGSPVSFPDLMQHPCGILSIVGGARPACARSRTISTACSSDLQPHPPSCPHRIFNRRSEIWRKMANLTTTTSPLTSMIPMTSTTPMTTTTTPHFQTPLNRKWKNFTIHSTNNYYLQ